MDQANANGKSDRESAQALSLMRAGAAGLHAGGMGPSLSSMVPLAGAGGMGPSLQPPPINFMGLMAQATRPQGMLGMSCGAAFAAASSGLPGHLQGAAAAAGVHDWQVGFPGGADLERFTMVSCLPF
jgi:hypothetical protein